MPWTTQPAVLDRSLAKWAALMCAVIVECAVFALEMGKADGDEPCRDGLDAAFRQLVRFCDLMPLDHLLCSPTHDIEQENRSGCSDISSFSHMMCLLAGFRTLWTFRRS